jgi:hypothetical protein
VPYLDFGFRMYDADASVYDTHVCGCGCGCVSTDANDTHVSSSSYNTHVSSSSYDSGCVSTDASRSTERRDS